MQIRRFEIGWEKSKRSFIPCLFVEKVLTDLKVNNTMHLLQQNFNGFSLETGFFSPTPGNTTKEIISLITSKARFVYPVVQRRESTHCVPRSNRTLNIVFKQFKFINSPFRPLCISCFKAENISKMRGHVSVIFYRFFHSG